MIVLNKNCGFLRFFFHTLIFTSLGHWRVDKCLALPTFRRGFFLVDGVRKAFETLNLAPETNSIGFRSPYPLFNLKRHFFELTIFRFPFPILQRVALPCKIRELFDGPKFVSTWKPPRKRLRVDVELLALSQDYTRSTIRMTRERFFVENPL